MLNGPSKRARCIIEIGSRDLAVSRTKGERELGRVGADWAYGFEGKREGGALGRPEWEGRPAGRKETEGGRDRIPFPFSFLQTEFSNPFSKRSSNQLELWIKTTQHWNNHALACLHQHVRSLMIYFINSSKILISLCFNAHKKHNKIKSKLFA